MSKVSERYASEALLREEAKKKLGLLLREGSVKTKHLSDSSVTSDKLDPRLLDNIDSTHKEAQDSLNKLQKWLNEYGGGILFKGDKEHFAVGESVIVTFEMEAQNGKPAHWIIKGNGQVLAEVTDTVSFMNTYTINKDTLFEAICEQGEMLFTGKWSVTAKFPTWLGAASAYNFIKTDNNKIGYGDHIQGKFEVNVVQDNSTLFLLSPKSTPISKVTMGGFEVPMKDPVEVNIAFPEYPEHGFSKVYYVYESLNTYNTGSFYVYINDDNDVIRGQYDNVSQEVESLRDDVEGVPVPDEEDITEVASTATELQSTLKFADKKYDPVIHSGLGRKYLRKNLVSIGEIKHFAGFVENVTIKSNRVITRDSDISDLYWDRIRECFVLITNPTQSFYAKCLYGNPDVPPTQYNTVVAYTDVLYETNGVYYYWNGEDLVVYGNFATDRNLNVLTQELFKDEDNHPLENTIFHVQYDYDLQGEEITVPDGAVLKFEGGSFTNGTLVLPADCKLEKPIINDLALKGCNTCFTDRAVNILEAYSSYITYENDKIYGVDKAINAFLSNLKNSAMIHGIVIKIPSGNYIITETIKLMVGVSLEGTTGTNFELDFSNSESDHIGILVDPYYYISTEANYDTNPYIEDSDTGYWNSLYRGRIKNLAITSKSAVTSETGQDDYIAIKDTHATHHLENLVFGGTLKRYIISENSISGTLRYYGDGRTIKNIHIGTESWDDYKIFLGPGDNQIIEGIVGHARVVCVRGSYHIRNCVTAEFIFVGCGNVIMDSCYSEVTGVRIYDSLVLANSCTFGTPEHGDYNSPNGVLRYRDKYLNCMEIDTSRILEDLLADGIISNPDMSGINWLSGVALRSNVTLNNVKFIGQDYRRDNKYLNNETTVREDEFNYIYRDSNSKGKLRIIGSCYAQPNYNTSVNFLRVYPLFGNANGPYLPACLEIGESVPTYILPKGALEVTTPDTSSVTDPDAPTIDMRKFSDLDEGTYHYRVGVMASLQHFIGDVSDDVSITLTKNSVVGKCPTVYLKLNAYVRPNQTIVIWRGTEEDVYTEMAYFTVPSGGTGNNPYTIMGDSKGMIYGVKWGSVKRNPLSDAFKKPITIAVMEEGVEVTKKVHVISSVERISDKNYRFIGGENIDISKALVKMGKVGDEIAIENVVRDNNDRITSTTETLWKAYKEDGGALKYVQITNFEDSSVSRIPLTEEFEGLGVYDSTLGKIVYVGNVNNEYVWVDAVGNTVELQTEPHP